MLSIIKITTSGYARLVEAKPLNGIFKTLEYEFKRDAAALAYYVFDAHEGCVWSIARRNPTDIFFPLASWFDDPNG